MYKAEVTGLCPGIINDNKVAYVKSYGYKNAAKSELNDTTTCFYAASLAKPLFAYLVMQLVDEKVIDPDKPLYTYLPKPLPGYENYKDLAGDDRWKLITARIGSSFLYKSPELFKYITNTGASESGSFLYAMYALVR
jgi:CubicO group peptidase (beta-lactamase class C family)